MKKWLLGLLLFTILSVAVSYVFIPNTIRINRFIAVNITQDGLNRAFFNFRDWGKWWPGKILPQTDSAGVLMLDYKNQIYNITGTDYGHLVLSIKNNHLLSKTSIIVIPKKMDSMLLVWEGSFATSYNPIKRLQIYFATQAIKKDIGLILERISNYYGKPENIYDIKIQYKLVTDSFLVSTFNETKNYPTTNNTYSLINKLRNYISSQSAKETGHPMLSIFKKDSTTWITKVAIPTDERLESSADISFKRMLGGGKILMTEIKGGPETIEKALQHIENFVNDYHYSSPAIPFQSLITDRLKEPDSSKWITRIYYPVM